ncbi:hypothetical protein Tco_0273742 [Tanacetum coccineum]
MSKSVEHAPTPADSVVQNTSEKGSKQITDGPMPDEKLHELCDKIYNQLLPLMAERVHQEKLQGEREKNVFTHLGEREKDVFSRLEPKSTSHRRQASAKRDASTGRATTDPDRRKREARNLVRSYATCSSERQREIKREWYAADRENRKKSTQDEETYLSESENDKGGYWNQGGTMGHANVVPHVQLYTNKVSPSESIHSYVELQKAFVANFIQQKKYIKDPVEIHHIKQREEESTEAFMEHFKAESMHVKGTPKCMRVSRFIHDITNLDLIKRLNDNIPKSVDEIMSLTITFLRGEVAVANHS